MGDVRRAELERLCEAWARRADDLAAVLEMEAMISGRDAPALYALEARSLARAIRGRVQPIDVPGIGRGET